MPRTLAPGELFKKITSIRLIREASGTHGDTDTTAAITGDGTETTVSVTASTNFTSGDECLISGSGGVEATKIGTPATSMPVSPPPRIPQAIGALFKEAELVDLGKYAKNSISLIMTKAITPIFEEIGDTPVVYVAGDAEFGLDFSLLSMNGLNLQQLLGYAADETGDGLAEGTAYQTPMGVSNQTLQGDQVVRVAGLRFDLMNLEIDFCNAFFASNINAALQRENPAQFTGSIRSSIAIVRQWV